MTVGVASGNGACMRMTFRRDGAGRDRAPPAPGAGSPGPAMPPPCGPTPPASPGAGGGFSPATLARARARLAEAGGILGKREACYGDAAVLFARLGRMWEPIVGRVLSAREVAWMLEALKLARLARDLDHADGWLDAIGYAALGAALGEDR